MTVVKLVTPKGGAKHELLFSKPTYVAQGNQGRREIFGGKLRQCKCAISYRLQVILFSQDIVI
jgi:hypothetical protein